MSFIAIELLHKFSGLSIENIDLYRCISVGDSLWHKNAEYLFVRSDTDEAGSIRREANQVWVSNVSFKS
jgi:hypothetical protein